MFSNVGRLSAEIGPAPLDGKHSRTAREQIKRDLQRVHDLVLLTLDRGGCTFDEI